MVSLSDFPKTYQASIRKAAEKLNTDYQTAYAMLLLEAMLWDLSVSDQAVIDLLIKDTSVEQVS